MNTKIKDPEDNNLLSKIDGSNATILIVEDDESTREILNVVLQVHYNILAVSTAEKALKVLSENVINVMILDLRLPGMSGISLLEEIGGKSYDLDVIIITAIKEVESAVKVMKYGVYDYITKDFTIDEITNIIHKIINEQTESKKVMLSEEAVEEKSLELGFVESKAFSMKNIQEVILKVAPLPTTVLLEGESGTGKEIVARNIHNVSGKESSPFIAINIASIPDGLMESSLFGHEKGAFTGAFKQHTGKFELANNGTLFLDEIGELKIDLQAKLLRVIQEGEFERVGGSIPIQANVRLIVATNKKLDKLVNEGKFREDLYYRLNIIPIHLPPLRERKEDIPLLIECFLAKYNEKFCKNIKGLTQAALSSLSYYKWPGNIRELENLVERFVAILDKSVITQSDIPVEYLMSKDDNFNMGSNSTDCLKRACDNFERNYILKVMEAAEWSRKEAAKRLGIPISTLKYKLSKQNLYKIISQKRKI